MLKLELGVPARIVFEKAAWRVYIALYADETHAAHRYRDKM